MLSYRIKIPNNNEIEIIQISREAKIAKAQNPLVIDATIGSLYDENGQFLENETLTQAINLLKPQQKYTYAPITGGDAYKEALEKWLFKKHLNAIKQSHHTFSLATVGGSSALNNLLNSYVLDNELVISTDSYWNVYQKMINAAGAKTMEFEMFDNENFNLVGFEKICIECLKHQNKLMIILNTPNHNPTGYSLKTTEFDAIVAFLNQQKVPVLIILDVAYLDFSDDHARDIFQILTKTKEHILTGIVFSGSKTLSAYGLRLGGLTLLNRQESVIENARATQTILNRVRYGSPNHLAVSAFVTIMNDEKLSLAFNDELVMAREMLRKRANLLIATLAQANIVHYPYDGGFFVCLKVNDAVAVYEKLKAVGIYTIPLQNGLRIAISSLQCAEIKRLVDGIKEYIN